MANAQAGSVSIVDAAAKKLMETLMVPFRSANRLKFTPDGKYALISDLGGTDVIVMDVATRKEVTRIDVGGGAAGIQMSPTERAFVAVGSERRRDRRSEDTSGQRPDLDGPAPMALPGYGELVRNPWLKT